MKMKFETPLDYAVFQLSPKRTRCELFVSTSGNTEKLASGLVKPFVTHLKVAEEQVALAVKSIKLEVKESKNGERWFTKGTLERFVRFVSTPEVLELVNTFDAEMSQLEAARRIYSLGAGDQLSSTQGGDGAGATAAADATKKELLRAIDVRLVAVRQDLTTACARAAAAGFTPDTVSELQMFAEQFGAGRLLDACSKFILLCERRPDLINVWRGGGEDRAVRSSYGSDMSIDEDPTDERFTGTHQFQHQLVENKQLNGQETVPTCLQHNDQGKSSTCQPPRPNFVAFPTRRSRESSIDRDDSKESDGTVDKEKKEENTDRAESIQTAQPSRRLSVQDRINMFENKQKETSGSGGKPVVGKSPELRRLSSDVSSCAPTVAEKAVLRRWSGVSDMSIDLSGEKKESESTPCTPSSSFVDQTKSEEHLELNDSFRLDPKSVTGRVGDSETKDRSDSQSCFSVTSSKEEFMGTHLRTQRSVSSGRLDDYDESSKSDSKVIRAVGDNFKDQTRGKTQSRSALCSDEESSLKDQTRGKPQSRSALCSDEETSLKNQAASSTQFRSLPGGRVEQCGLRDQGSFRHSLSASQRGGTEELVASQMQIAGLKDSAAHQGQIGAFEIRSAEPFQLPHGKFPNRVEDVELRGDSVSQSRHKASSVRYTEDSRQFEGSSGLKPREVPLSRTQAEDGPLAYQPSWRSSEKNEEVRRNDLPLSETQYRSSASKFEDSEQQKIKFQKQFSAPEQVKKSHGRTDESKSHHGGSNENISGKLVSEVHEGLSSSMIPAQQVQRTRQSKGNQELNDELKLKANELEKLFAEHKLRLPGDQLNNARRTQPADKQQVEPAGNLPFRKQAAEFMTVDMPEKNPVAYPVGSSSNAGNLSASSLMKMTNNQEHGDDLNQKFIDLNVPDDFRGNFYDRYVQKRDAKLREEWVSGRAEKEAKMKAMQDVLELSRAEMKAKFSGSADRQDSVFNARHRAERLRSFNIRANVKQEQQLDFVQSADDYNLSEFPEQKSVDYDLSYSDTSFGDSAPRSTQNKKLFPNRNSSSSTPRTSVAPPVPRSAIKASNSSSTRRKMQPDNPLAQSVPNFSDLRKENTKPYSVIGKTTSRPQLRSYARSKSASEETSIPLVKEEKSRRSHTLRKSCASPAEFKDISPSNSEGIVLAPLKLDKETEPSHFDKFMKNVPSKPFLRKGNGIGPGAGAGVAKLKASAASDIRSLDEEYDQLTFEPEDPVNDADRDEEEEEIETMTTEDNNDMDYEKPRRSQEESDKSVISGSENGDTLGSFSQVETSLVAELPAAESSTFHAMGAVQDSPGESPMSWNSRMHHHPFSYTHETSDIDASADSPMGSPASWNSHSLNQSEADAARMRKKWGSAQKPIVVTSSSHNQSRKDMTKGFKRLLKFGRKTRGTDSLVDWISATTSEGDDDTEDGRDPANRSSEDLRKSRMGFSQGHPSDDSFNESEFFSEQVQGLHSSIPAPPANFKLREDHLSGSAIKAPRSFFSLSTFRSKGSDSKPR